MMFGYATRETDELMPLPISLAHRLAQRLAEVRKARGRCPTCGPDGKTQVTVRYRDGVPVAIEKVLISTQHRDGVDSESLIKPDLFEHVLEPVLPADLYDAAELRRNFLVNPTGRFVIGGPVGDCGLTGRRSSSTPTAAWPVTAAARSRARTRRRSTAAPRTPPATSPRTSWPRAWPTGSRSRSPTRSASRTRCR